MAEFRDWLNRTLLHLDLRDEGLEFFVYDIRLVFQKKIFINDVVGWRVDAQAEVRLYNFFLNRRVIDEFLQAAKNWLALPLDLLGSTYFSGKWSFAANDGSQFNLEFQPYYSTPSKTDWFTVRIEMRTEDFSWSEELQSDYTCLALFVEGLSSPA